MTQITYFYRLPPILMDITTKIVKFGGNIHFL